MSNFFPSVSVSWDLSREPFLNQLLWLNQFSVSANYGISGSYPLNTFAKDLYSINAYYYFNGGLVNSKSVSQLANHYIKPEMINEFDLGLNIDLLDKRIKLGINYYNKTNNNLAIIRDIPAYYGGGKAILNIGEVANIGKEINLDVEPIRTSKFLWVSSFSISFNKQEVKNAGQETKIKFYNIDELIPEFDVTVNEEVGVMKGFKYLGPWTSEDTKLKDKRYYKEAGGKYLKTDTTTTKIGTNDFVTIGKTLPDYTWHWNNQFIYKNFALEILWYAVIGVDKYNGTRASTYMSGLNTDIKEFVKRGDISMRNFTFYRSSYFVEDASFVRMKRLTFSYTFGKKVFNYAELKLSMSLENLITITKYSGYDPESSIYTDNSFSDLGVDRGAYPNPKSIFFSLTINL
jgi:outer membrane receptor protein involved in Fe transport